jgi:hypothetical protein
VGVAFLAAGSITGLIAKSKNDQAAKLCSGSACTSQDALTLTDDARSAATASTVCFVAGGVALTAGILVYALAPKSRSTTGLRVTPLVGQGGTGLVLSGGWR